VEVKIVSLQSLDTAVWASSMQTSSTSSPRRVGPAGMGLFWYFGRLYGG